MDKPWRPADHPRPLLHLVEPEPMLNDPDLTPEQHDRVGIILAIAFAFVLSAIFLIGFVAWINHVQNAVSAGR